MIGRDWLARQPRKPQATRVVIPIDHTRTLQTYGTALRPVHPNELRRLQAKLDAARQALDDVERLITFEVPEFPSIFGSNAD